MKLILGISLILTICSSCSSDIDQADLEDDPQDGVAMPSEGVEASNSIPSQIAEGIAIISLEKPGTLTRMGRGPDGRIYHQNDFKIINTIQEHYEGIDNRPITLYPDPGPSPRKIILYHHENGNWIEYSTEVEQQLTELYSDQ